TADGNSNATQAYSFADSHPAVGANYYRLKQVGVDGAFNYSDVQLLHFDTKHHIQIVPNPTQSYFVVNGLLGHGTIAVADISGKVLVSESVDGGFEKRILVEH